MLCCLVLAYCNALNLCCRMAMGESDVVLLTQAQVETDDLLRKRKSHDVGALVDPLDKEKVRSKLCGHPRSGGIYRPKKHVAHVGTSVAKCSKNSHEAKDKCKISLDEGTHKRKEKKSMFLGLERMSIRSRVGSNLEPDKLGAIDK